MDEMDQLIRTTLSELKQMASTHTAVGDPITIDDAVVIPLVRVGFGYGAGMEGSGARKARDHARQISGGGAGIQPVALVIIQQGAVRVESLTAPVIRTAAPNPLVEKAVELIKSLLNKRG